jgi:hypothetical protein
VSLKLCSADNCRHFDYSDTVKPGRTHPENISDRELLTRWLVEDAPSGRRLGCLPLEFDQKYADVLVRISQMVPCPGSHPISVEKGKPEGRS